MTLLQSISSDMLFVKGYTYTSDTVIIVVMI